MSIRQILDRQELVSCGYEATLSEVARLMKDKDVGAVVVTDEGKPAGIITDRDVMIRSLCDGPENTGASVREVMSTPVRTITADAGIHDLVSVMGDEGIRRVVVTDDNNQALGVLSSGDILELLSMEMGRLITGIGPRKEKLVSHEGVA